jgi:hypothetical protein
VRLDDLELMAETYLMTFGRNVNFISIGKPFKIGKNTYSTGFSWLNYIAGSDFEGRSSNSLEPTVYISDSSHIFVFSVATYLSERLYIGANTKILIHNLYESRGTGIGFDIGLFSNVWDTLNIGASLLNISTNISWDKNAHMEALPLIFMGGVSYDFTKIFGLDELDVLLSTDVMSTTFGSFRMRAGMEIKAYKMLFIRAGYNGSLSAGLGVKLRTSDTFSIMFDYAFVADNIITNEANHRIGINLDYIFPHWGGKRVEDASGERVVKPESEKESVKTETDGVDGYDW